MAIQRAIAIVVVACMLFAGLVIMTPTASAATESSPASYPLYAGQKELVGNVLVWNDGDSIYVKYVVTAPGWYLTEVHVQVNKTMAEIPQTAKGNPIPGHFVVNEEYSVADQVIEAGPFAFDMSDLGVTACTNAVIAAHAVVQNGDRSETAWGAQCVPLRNGFPGNNWATYINYDVTA